MAATESYTLSLHDALPISDGEAGRVVQEVLYAAYASAGLGRKVDRKSTRLNSSHPSTSYAVFCLKKKTGASAPTTSSPGCSRRGSSSSARRSTTLLPNSSC